MNQIISNNDNPQLKEKWLSALPHGQRYFIQKTTDAIMEFSEGESSPFFQTCGLYVVGSSLKGLDFNDVDFVLVGLDFRAAAHYGKIFLQDPQALVEKEIVVKPRAFMLEGTTKEGNEILKPASKTNTIEGFMRKGIEYNGELYEYDIDRFAGDALNLETYCSYDGEASQLSNDLLKFIEVQLGHEQKRWGSTPFGGYEVFGEFAFSTFRYEITPCIRDVATRENLSQEDTKNIDLNIHAENLFVPAWKHFQREYGMPYIALHEWPDAQNIGAERPILTDLPLPDFIDEKGFERVPPYHSYFPCMDSKRPIVTSFSEVVKEIEEVKQIND